MERAVGTTPEVRSPSPAARSQPHHRVERGVLHHDSVEPHALRILPEALDAARRRDPPPEFACGRMPPLDPRTVPMQRTRSHPSLSLAIVAALAASLPTPASAQDDAAPAPPSARETDTLVAEYLTLDGRTEEGRSRQAAIEERLELLPPLNASRERTWRRKIAKLWDKGPKLEKKAGPYHLWEEGERGLYILGGETKKPKGLFIGMHGGGVDSGDARSAHGAFDAAADDAKWLGIFPQVLEKTERGWTDSGTEEFILELIERALRTWKIDRDQVYFGGHSMGGYGSWTLGGHHADLVAGLIPSAGAPTPVMTGGGRILDIDAGVVPNLRNTSIVVYQSIDDPRVSPDANQFAVKRLAEAQKRWGGFDYEYWEVDGRGHGPPPGDEWRSARRSRPA